MRPPRPAIRIEVRRLAPMRTLLWLGHEAPGSRLDPSPALTKIMGTYQVTWRRGRRILRRFTERRDFDAKGRGRLIHWEAGLVITDLTWYEDGSWRTLHSER